MFKFRRSSLCSNPEVVTNNSGSDEEDFSFGSRKGSLRNSISESRLASSTYDSDEKESLSESSSDSLLLQSFGTKTSTDSYKTTVVVANTEVVFEKCRVNGNNSESGSGTALITMPDRKRKERHESSSQEQEKKVIKGDDSDVYEARVDGNDIASKSPDKNANNMTTENAPVISEEAHKSQNIPTPANPTYPTLQAAPQVGYGLRNIPSDFEPEVQRQMERTAAQWNARKMKKPHRSRHSKSAKSFSEVDDLVSNGCQARKLEGLSISNRRTYSNSAADDKANETASDGQNSSGTLSDADQESETEIPEAHVHLAPLPALDLSTLHQSVDSQEPVSAYRLSYASDHVLLSPRNNTLIQESIGSAPTPPVYQNPVNPPANRQVMDSNQETRMHSIMKQVGNLKRHIRALDSEYEKMFGNKPSQADRQSNKDMRKSLIQLTKAKKELQLLRDDPTAQITPEILKSNFKKNRFPTTINTGAAPRAKAVSDETLKQLEVLVNQVQNSLEGNRDAYGRPEDPLLMTQQELVSEKNSMQRQLLMLEKKYGRPESKEEKEIVKNLYSRYRLVKKLSFRFSAERENSFDLVPIIEHETLEFPKDNDKQTQNLSEDSSSEITETIVDTIAVKEHLQKSTDAEIDLKNEDFKDMTLPELESKHKLASDEKRRLRTILRKFEVEFQNSTGRAPQKEDKYSSSEVEVLYQKYKHFRANTKLLDVLIAKKKYPFPPRVDLSKVED